MQPILSILICSIQSRAGMLGALLREIQRQIDEINMQDQVEVRVNLDNKEKSTGKKRQELLELATGKFVVAIDDDDWISEDYISEVLKGCQTNCDVIAINGWIETNGRDRINWETSIWFDNVTVVANGERKYLRTVNHICPAKRELALQAGFPDKSNAEDSYYSERLRPLLGREYKIEKQIYFYRFSTFNKEYK